MKSMNRIRRTPAMGLLVGALVLGMSACTGSRNASTPAPSPAASPEGDFRAGDVVRVTIREEPELSGEFRVDDELVLDLQRLGQVPLRGVRRADAPRLIEARVRKVVINPMVEVEPLVRVAVLGEVTKPGFYASAGDATLTDVLTLAGGPTQQADLRRIVILRADERVASREEVSQALTEGATLDQLRLRSGDRLQVGEESKRSWIGLTRELLWTASAAATLVTILVTR